MVTTTRAERPASPFLASGLLPSRANAKPGRATCSRKPLSRAGMSPSHSGKKNTMCSAQPMSAWGWTRLAGMGPSSHSAWLRSSGKSSVATSIRRTVCPPCAAAAA